MAGDSRVGDRQAALLRIKLKYGDVDTFIEKYAVNISRGGIFIASRTPKAVGTTVRFEFLLAQGAEGVSIIRGEGQVQWVREFDPAQPQRPHGMGLRFTQLDGESQKIIDRALAWRQQNLPPPKPERREQSGLQTLPREQSGPLPLPAEPSGPIVLPSDQSAPHPMPPTPVAAASPPELVRPPVASPPPPTPPPLASPPTEGAIGRVALRRIAVPRAAAVASDDDGHAALEAIEKVMMEAELNESDLRNALVRVRALGISADLDLSTLF